MDETGHTTWQPNKRKSNHSLTPTPFIQDSRPIAPVQRAMNPIEQVKRVYQMEIEARKEEVRAWQEKYEVVNGRLIAVCTTYFNRKAEWEREVASSQRQIHNGNLVYNEFHRQLKASESAYQALQTRAESSEQNACRWSKQVEELTSALAAKEEEFKLLKEASAGRESDLEQPSHISQTDRQDRDQRVSEPNDRLVACCPTEQDAAEEETTSKNQDAAEDTTSKEQEIRGLKEDLAVWKENTNKLQDILSHEVAGREKRDEIITRYRQFHAFMSSDEL